MSTYLVAGCSGFIGWKVCEFLLTGEHRVLGIDNLNDAYDVRLKRWRLAQLEPHPRFAFRATDICDRRALESGTAGQQFDAVINLAARAGGRQSLDMPQVYYDTNVSGTLNLLELCRRREIPKFVLASTSSLYGAHNPRPFREDADTSRPLSPYAASKKAAEALTYTYHYLYGLDVTVLRYFTVYGPAGRPDMSLFRFVQWISEGKPVQVYDDGTQERDFTYVDDVARGTIAGVAPIGYEIINLGSDRPVVLKDAIRLLEELIGRAADTIYLPAHKADVRATWADITKAQRQLNWRPQYPFKEGVTSLVSWYRENRDWAKEIRTD